MHVCTIATARAAIGAPIFASRTPRSVASLQRGSTSVPCDGVGEPRGHNAHSNPTDTRVTKNRAGFCPCVVLVLCMKVSGRNISLRDRYLLLRPRNWARVTRLRPVLLVLLFRADKKSKKGRHPASRA